MSVIWIICPLTRQEASTGIETDAESFAALTGLTPVLPLTLSCPSCGNEHAWADMRGYLVEAPGKQLN